MTTNADRAVDRIIDEMAEVLVRRRINPSDATAVCQAWTSERFGVGAILAFGGRAKCRALELLALLSVVGIIPLPAAADELRFVATEAGVKGTLLTGISIGVFFGFLLGVAASAAFPRSRS